MVCVNIRYIQSRSHAAVVRPCAPIFRGTLQIKCLIVYSSPENKIISFYKRISRSRRIAVVIVKNVESRYRIERRKLLPSLGMYITGKVDKSVIYKQTIIHECICVFHITRSRHVNLSPVHRTCFNVYYAVASELKIDYPRRIVDFISALNRIIPPRAARPIAERIVCFVNPVVGLLNESADIRIIKKISVIRIAVIQIFEVVDTAAHCEVNFELEIAV